MVCKISTASAQPSKTTRFRFCNEAISNLSNLKLWLEGNKLSLNVSKTQAILIGSRAKLQNISKGGDIRPKFIIDDEVVSMINEAKYLGIQIDKIFKLE